MSGTKGMLHYSIEIKQEAVRLFLEEGYTYQEIAKQLEMRLAGRIKVWVRQYRREGATAFTRPIGRPRKQAESEQGELERLRMENALLKNFSPNCARICSRSAVSDNLSLPRRVPGDPNVYLPKSFASCVLCMAKTIYQIGSGYRANEAH